MKSKEVDSGINEKTPLILVDISRYLSVNYCLIPSIYRPIFTHSEAGPRL
jgi:hypothetical protein